MHSLARYTWWCVDSRIAHADGDWRRCGPDPNDHNKGTGVESRSLRSSQWGVLRSGSERPGCWVWLWSWLVWLEGQGGGVSSLDGGTWAVTMYELSSRCGIHWGRGKGEAWGGREGLGGWVDLCQQGLPALRIFLVRPGRPGRT